MPYFAYSFISDHITTNNCYYLLSLCKTKRENKMEIEFEKVWIKNCTCYYFDDIIKLEDFDHDIFIEKKSDGNILIYDILYKLELIWNLRFFKIDGIMRIYDRTRYLTLFGSEIHDSIYRRIKYPNKPKSGITYIFSHYFRIWFFT